MRDRVCGLWKRNYKKYAWTIIWDLLWEMFSWIWEWETKIKETNLQFKECFYTQTQHFSSLHSPHEENVYRYSLLITGHSAMTIMITGMECKLPVNMLHEVFYCVKHFECSSLEDMNWLFIEERDVWEEMSQKMFLKMLYTEYDNDRKLLFPSCLVLNWDTFLQVSQRESDPQQVN